MTFFRVVACSQAWISYNPYNVAAGNSSVVACSQAWISYNNVQTGLQVNGVVACSQAWISYNSVLATTAGPALWLALRHGLVAIKGSDNRPSASLWLALRHGLVTI